MQIRGIIFDLDGTLADTIPICIHAHQHAFREFLGRSFSDDEIVAMFGPSEEGITDRWVPKERYQDCLECFLQEYDRSHAACSAPFPGVTDLLDRLCSRGVRMAIVTGKGPRSAEISLRHLGIARYFDAVETGAPEGVIKPRCITRVLERWGLAGAEAVYIGDAVADIASAREAGVLPLAAAWAPSARPDLLEAAGPSVLFRTVGDFDRWITDAGITGQGDAK